MIELVNPKIHAVNPDPHVKATFLFGSTLFFWNISINSFLFLKVLSLLINSVKGIFLEPLIFPLLSPSLGSGWSPKNLFLLLASTSSKELFLILAIIWSLFNTNEVFSLAE